MDNETGNIAEQENFNITAGGASNITKGTNINKTNNINETSLNETEEINAENITSPTGSVTYLSREDGGEYFCNKNITPIHALRVYTYKIINGTKNLSKSYIESSKISACDDYDNESVTNGITYSIEWSWDAVDRIDGYRIYQYYINTNVSRNYNDFLDIKTNKFLDTNFDLW